MTGPSKIRAGLAGTVGGAIGAVVLIVGLASPVEAASRKQAPPDPVTMGSVQIVNAMSSDGVVTISLDGRVRARGVPSMASTSPLALPAGAHLVVVTYADLTSSTPTSNGGGHRQRQLPLDIAAGSRRTAFLTGTVLAPQLVVVDTAGDVTKSAKTAQVVDLRSPARRTVVRVAGLVAKLGDGGLSAPFAVSGKATIDVVGGDAATPPTLDSTAGPSYVFVVSVGEGVSVGSVRQNLVRLDSLRSPAPVVVPVRTSLFGLFASIALVLAATGAAMSSMIVFRGRIRDERVRGLMAKSFGL